MRIGSATVKTNFDYPPIPIRSMDWSAWRDGREEWHIGRGATESAAIADLREQLTDSGYEEQTEDHEREARAAYEAAPKPRTEICQECNEPIIDGQASCHKMGCKSNQEIEF